MKTHREKKHRQTTIKIHDPEEANQSSSLLLCREIKGLPLQHT